MIQWDFKDKIFYQGKEITQDSRKFEIMLEEYLRIQYPLQNWKLTKATRDGNKDLESICEFSGTSMWAEAKYTLHTDENLSSRKYDSTLVSSMFEHNLIKVFFITNTLIGPNLIGRIKKFYYLSAIKQIAFIDGYNLTYWIKAHPEIEKKFFKKPVEFTIPSTPDVQLKGIRVLCKSDSYTIDNILEDQVVYPLYLSKNYIIEGEFTAVGFESTPLELYCNDVLLHKKTVPPEITSFFLNIDRAKEVFNVNREYPLHIYYILNSKKYECGDYILKFAVMGELYQNQIKNYKVVEKGIKASYKKIYNIYGPQNSGKSWLLTNLKNDLLKKAQPNQRIIYVNFNGVDADIVDICRIIFTIILEYYNLNISGQKLSSYCSENGVKNSVFNSKNIEALIYSLQNNDYEVIQSILKGSIFSNKESIFEIKQCFEYEKIYFIDNIHLLSPDNRCILQAILDAFDPMKGILFVLTSRTEVTGRNIVNLHLDYVDNIEILKSIEERIAFKIWSLNEILPQNHYLFYPGLLHSFLKDICSCTSAYDIKQYYMNVFHESATQYVKGRFPFDNIVLLLICFVKAGIPLQHLLSINTTELGKLFNEQLVTKKYGYIYPNFERWNGEIPVAELENYKKELVAYIEWLMDVDSNRKEVYQCSLMIYFPEHYNRYFGSIFECISQKFNENKYCDVAYMCETLVKKQDFYFGDPENLNFVKYFLAFSYMHCDASKNAQNIFREISKSYELRAKTTLYFEAESELIDAEYWSFHDFSKLPKHINKFCKDWRETLSEIPNLKTRTYLTATNRMMVTYLALDQMELAEVWFKKNIKLAVQYDTMEHLGYTFMDYAKGIYHKNLALALQYLLMADTYFQTPSEQRRHADCLCEIQYVKVLLGETTIPKLLLAQETLFDGQYWIQYYKCHLKLAVCYSLKGEKSNAIKHLLEAEASAIIKNDERIHYLCNMIETFLYRKPVPYENAALAGTSYQKVIDHMQFIENQEKAVLYVMGNNAPVFYIDPRVW